jgi:serine/threonine protein kinase
MSSGPAAGGRWPVGGTDSFRLRIPGLSLVRRLRPAGRAGHGAADTVLARDGTGAELAVRIFRQRLRSVRDRGRYTAEVGRIRALPGDTGVAEVRDAGITRDGVPYLVTDYCPDGSLEDRLALLGRFTPAEVAGLGAALATALHRVHELGVIHRNLKPSNILTDAAGEPVLADFGLVAVTTAGGEYGVAPALPSRYAAPEARAPESMGPTADIFALGAILYALLLGDSSPTGHRIEAPLGDLVPDLIDAPAPLLAALRRAMATDPRDRYPAAGDLAGALAAAY